jgi:hypothetical protein
MRVAAELCAIVVAGFLAFLLGIAVIAGMILLWLCGIAGSLMLVVSLFAAMMYAVTGKHHDLVLALGYLCYAAVPFVVIFAVTYYQGKIDKRFYCNNGPRSAAWKLDVRRST